MTSPALAETIAEYIRRVDSMHQLNRDGLGTVVMRHLHALGAIRLDQVREVSRFVADNANMIPGELAEAIVTEFHLTEEGNPQ